MRFDGNLWSMLTRGRSSSTTISNTQVNIDVTDIESTHSTAVLQSNPNDIDGVENFVAFQKNINSSVRFENVRMNSIVDGRDKPILLFLP